MNKNITTLFIMIFNSVVIRISTNPSELYRMSIAEDVGIKFSLSTFRKKFKENKRFSHTDINGRVYWFQRFDNPKIT